MPKATAKHGKKAARHARVARPARKHPARKPAPAREPAVTEQEVTASEAKQTRIPVLVEEIDFVEGPEIIGFVSL